MKLTTCNNLVLGLLVLQLLSVFAVIMAADNELDEIDRELVNIFLRSNRKTKDDDTDKLEKELEKNPLFIKCEEHLMTFEGELSTEMFEKCLAACMFQGMRIDIDFGHPECIASGGNQGRELSTGLEPFRRKWRPFRKIGAWFKKNKGKIIKALQTVGRIIGGIVKAIGK